MEMLAQVEGWLVGVITVAAGLVSGAAVWLRGLWKDSLERKDKLAKEAAERKDKSDKESNERKDVERRTAITEWQEFAAKAREYTDTLRKEYEARVVSLQQQLDKLQLETIQCERERGRLEVAMARQEGQISLLTVTVDRLQKGSGDTTSVSVPTVIAADEDGVIYYVGDGAIDLLQYTPDQLVGKSVDVLIPGRYLERHRAGMDKLRTLQVAVWEDKVIVGDVLTMGGKEVPVTIKLKAWRRTGPGQHHPGSWMVNATIRRREEPKAPARPAG